MIATKKRDTKLRVENLDSRLLLTTYTVGPGQMFGALHEVPWDKVVGGDTVKVYWQANPYKDKIVLNNSGTQSKPIFIIGVAGPNGQLPVITGLGAIENPQAKFWSSQVSAQGIFTIAPIGYSDQVSWITISNFELKDAIHENWFINKNGEKKYYNYGAAGVALYHATDITISNCYIHDNENGIFGKSEGWTQGDLRNIKVKGNTFKDNGVANKYYYHNTYIEGINTIYEYNKYYKPKAWSAGCNLKDRGCGTIIRYNWFEGGVRIIDLVDPEDGAPSFLKDPLWGHTYVYGNIIINPLSGANTMIHFGFDGKWENAQVNLHFYNNTVININDQTNGGRYYTYVFKCDNDNQTVWAANNIFFSYSPVDGHWSGDFYLMTGGGRLNLGVNWVPSWTKNGNVYLLKGENNLMKGSDPGFVDVKNNIFSLKKDSPCIVGKQTGPYRRSFVPKVVQYEYDFKTGTWILKSVNVAIGAVG